MTCLHGRDVSCAIVVDEARKLMLSLKCFSSSSSVRTESGLSSSSPSGDGLTPVSAPTERPIVIKSDLEVDLAAQIKCWLLWTRGKQAVRDGNGISKVEGEVFRSPQGLLIYRQRIDA